MIETAAGNVSDKCYLCRKYTARRTRIINDKEYRLCIPDAKWYDKIKIITLKGRTARFGEHAAL